VCGVGERCVGLEACPESMSDGRHKSLSVVGFFALLGSLHVMYTGNVPSESCVLQTSA
jgi:hypothetical protein